MAGPSEGAAEPPYPSPGYSWYVVGVLTLVYVFSFIDRQILSLLVGPIRRDLGISDTQMSLLMGFTFAVFYTFFGIPLGRLADSRSRRSIIAVGFAAWSVACAACGLARNFGQMALARIGVGVGEASLSPSAYSLIADYFPPERRATAISVYGMGIYIGAGLAYLLGGLVIGAASAQELRNLPWIGATRPWQIIFFVIGLPGVVLALLLYTVREPLRRGGARWRVGLPLREVAAYVWENKAVMLCHNFGFAFIAFGTYAGGAWIPTFFMRRFGWTAADIGVAYGLIAMTCGSAGIYLGGRAADWMLRRGIRDATLRVPFYAVLMAAPLNAAMLLSPDARLSLALLLPLSALLAAPFGVAPAAIQQLMPNPMRGQASALYLYVNNMVGLGLGPTAVALITDHVFHNDAMVGYSLLLVSASGAMISASLFRLGRKPFLRSLDRLHRWTAEHS